MIIESTQQDREMICPPDPERVIEGLRDTGYNFNTAIADLIDNSIAAGAKQIDINIVLRPDGSVAVYVADNGSGMNEAELKNAMTYGSKRRSDPSSLGKFGLGLKTASTAFCRCLSVISRDSTGTVRKAQWDLDHIAVVKEWKLRMPDPNPDELQLLSQTATGTGTLVVWEKVDRLLKSYQKRKHLENALNKKIETLRSHIAMVFQRFLDHNDTRAANVAICLNTQPIEPWDPFCLSEKDTEKLAEESIPVELPNGQKTSFTLTAFMIPRRESFSTPAAMTKAKVNNDMQGFYVYRENRLIHYGDWFGMYVNEPHFSLLRIDLSFDHTMDVAFDIDIKKSRILMADEIAAYIKDNFTPPPRRAASDRYRMGVRKGVSAKSSDSDAHNASNSTIDSQAPKAEEAKVTETGTDEVQIENKHGSFQHKISVLSKQKDGQFRVIPVDTLENGQLWEPCIVDGKHAVKLNKSHPYYQKVYYPVLGQNVMVIGMDSLLWSLAESELGTYNNDTKEYYEDMRIMVSRVLKKLIANLPDPDPDTEDESE